MYVGMAKLHETEHSVYYRVQVELSDDNREGYLYKWVYGYLTIIKATEEFEWDFKKSNLIFEGDEIRREKIKAVVKLIKVKRETGEYPLSEFVQHC